ncbi:hypothetical protein CW662_00230 [Macrococcoides caseolyticum]|uniref:HNH endonuclease n=1 Tax=Macrococcoides caseolyticum TaxID=69966 RepID=UPI000C33024A|nr:HNH endonuclease [Macrococcus caseolyticus]PKE70963.1 hypothetical protein CW662_00230 [Macrococcus caseolyticus]
MENKYKIAFELVEDTLINFKEDKRKATEDYDNHFENLNATLLAKYKKLEYLEQIENELNNIINLVQPEFKKLIELIYIKGIDFKNVSEELGVSTKKLMDYHKIIVDEMVGRLGLGESRVEKYKRNERYIPTKIKEEVINRDNGICKRCGSGENLQFHHHIRFSEGGRHDVDNLMLLCNVCHTEEHKDEPAYYMMKSQLRGVKPIYE